MSTPKNQQNQKQSIDNDCTTGSSNKLLEMSSSTIPIQQQQQQPQHYQNDINNTMMKNINETLSPADSSSLVGNNKKSLLIQNGAMAGSHGTTSSEEFVIGLASGIMFGFISPILGHPFDTVKTRMQADPIYTNKSMIYTIKNIYQTNGIINGFYRGFLPPLLGSMTFRGLQFSIYGASFNWYENQYKNRNNMSSYFPILNNEPIPYTNGLKPSILYGSFMASIVRSAIESPLDYIKVRKMVGQSTMHNEIIIQSNLTTSSKKTILVNEINEFCTAPIKNIQLLYKGYIPTFLRTFGLLGSFFIMVDYSVRYIPDVVTAPTIGPFFKGAICSTVAWFFAFPFEISKSIIQGDATNKYTKIRYPTIYILRELYTNHGIINGIYRGFGPGASRSFFANGTSMVVFSYTQDLIRSNM
jgi:solute carrier family 25 (mitochondrial carnitine/acylcarnitine transporter), member 20/29